MTISVEALAGLPEITRGADLAALIATSARRLSLPLQAGDVLAVAQKVVSKAEGQVVSLADLEPSARALEIAATTGRDARVVEQILRESADVLRVDPRALICRTHHGFVCANAGVDGSNTGGADRLVLLPRDPDLSARRLRAALREQLGCAPAVVITDSFGRPWRLGQVEVAIGCAGLQPLDDWRGRTDADGRKLTASAVAVADQLAAAADLARNKASREPVVRIRGCAEAVSDDDGPGVVAGLLRAPAEDLFL